jgi:hypothetical protein
MSGILEVAQAIQNSEVGDALAHSIWVFPLVEATHLLGLAVSVGLLLFVDLRLLGLVLRQVPAVVVMNQLRRWIFVGFAVTSVTGVLLFWSQAGDMVFNPAFIAHSILIVLGVANALFFETRLAPKAAEWGDSLRLPKAARIAGLASLSSWILVAASGRLIPYLA